VLLVAFAIQERLWCRSDTAVNVNYVDRAISDACLGGDALDVRPNAAYSTIPPF
jgi:hypothetical protein